jgi:aminoglycoside phosphotransferase (APT) family kinase protein
MTVVWNDETWSRIGSWITTASQAAGVVVTEPKKLGGGAIQENWAVTLVVDRNGTSDTFAAVLRTSSPSTLEVSHTRAQEYALLKAAHGAGVTVPEPLWLCTDASVLGQDFYLMRRVAGQALGRRIVTDPTIDGERLAERLGRELAKLHAVVPPRTDLGFLSPPDSNPALRAVAQYRGYLDELNAPRPAVEFALRWLETNVPPATDIVLCHHDFRTGNYMVHAGRLTGILDWEFADWSDPHDDLAWFCIKYWRFGRTDRPAGGLGSRQAFYDGYRAVNGRRIDPERIRYWEIMGNVRWAVVALQQGWRHLSGREPSLDLALTGRHPPEMEREMLSLLAEAEGRSS